MQKIKRLFPLLVGGAVAVGAVLAVASLAWSDNAMASSLPTASSTGAAVAYLAAGQAGTGTTTGAVSPVSPDSPQTPQTPASPANASSGSASGGTVSVDLGGSLGKPSQSITIIIGLTLLAVAPSLLILLTSFTRIIIVLSLTRQALGLQTVPPNQLLAGLALFLSLFIMSPVISQVNSQAVQPYLAGKITAEQAYTDAQAPLKTWMLKQTQADDLALFEKSGTKLTSPGAMPMAAVVPAFALSEMRSAFIIGFVIFVPFLVIDLVVSSTLMSLGMMMLPPSLVSLPFKLLLFVLVDGWALVVQSLLASFH
jgi:flagellar biosynthetic protein FliP